MEMRKCENGHYYDASTNASCPYCKPVSAGATAYFAGGGNSFQADGDSGKTLAMEGLPQDSGRTLAMDGGARETGNEGTGAYNNERVAFGDDDSRTVSVIRQAIGIDPVVGWLVCINGKEKGRDYRVHADNNYIGRSEKMDICIRGDETISRENHAVISYDTVDRIFYFSPGDGRSIVRFNGKALFQTTQLNSHDHIVIGKTELVFVPFCDEHFNWMDEQA